VLRPGPDDGLERGIGRGGRFLNVNIRGGDALRVDTRSLAARWYAGYVLALLMLAALLWLLHDVLLPFVGGIALAYNARDKAEVDRVLIEAKTAGAKILKPAQEVFWGGYSGYFADPDGHPWEVAHNPFWPIGEDGRPILP